MHHYKGVLLVTQTESEIRSLIYKILEPDLCEFDDRRSKLLHFVVLGVMLVDGLFCHYDSSLLTFSNFVDFNHLFTQSQRKNFNKQSRVHSRQTAPLCLHKWQRGSAF